MSADTTMPAASSSKLDSTTPDQLNNNTSNSSSSRLSTSNAPRLSFTPASPIPRVPSAPVLPTPTEDRTAWLNHTTVPASARTSFSRVDATRVGTPEPHDEAEEDHAREMQDDPHANAHPASPSPVPEAVEMPVAPQASLTFLTVSGLRRTMAFDPDAAVGRVKELLWSSWPSEWPDARPPAPGFLRILHLGKILDDEDTLTKLKISADPALPPTIVHLSIRSAPPPGEEDVKKSKRKASMSSGGGDDDARAGGCCGCIIA